MPLGAGLGRRLVGQRSRLRAERRESEARVYGRHLPRGTDRTRADPIRGHPKMGMIGRLAFIDEVVQIGLDARGGFLGRPQLLTQGFACYNSIIVGGAIK